MAWQPVKALRPSTLTLTSLSFLLLFLRFRLSTSWTFKRAAPLLRCSLHHARIPSSSLSPSSTSSSLQADGGSSSAAEASMNTKHEILHHSDFLGDIYKIQIGNEDDFLGANAVPTFAVEKTSSRSTLDDEITNSKFVVKARGLEGALQQGPAFVLDQVLSEKTCNELIDTFETLKFGSYHAGKNVHGALQIVVPVQVADAVGQVLSHHIDLNQVMERRQEMLQKTHGDDSKTHDVRLVCAGLNRRWRVYRYAPGGEETFAPHIDAGFPPSGLSSNGKNLIWDDTESFLEGATSEIVSRLTVLLYLNDDFNGGQTNFHQPKLSRSGTALSGPSVIASVTPIAGSCLVFPQGVGEEAVEYARQHWPLHEGSPVISGTRPKYVIRSDVLFATTREALPLTNELFQHDHLVRHTFLPKAMTDHNVFLSHVSSLYNPHMGVENLGPFLYSLVRFTKKQTVVEIGAGYTSLWILKALKDNEDEMKSIKNLNEKEKCKLLNIDWADAKIVEQLLQKPSTLICIDNCEHQKETATGACAVAKSLGLDTYLRFLKGNAFEMGDYLKDESIDILWCDFGVGSRMKEFISGAWSSLKPGGLFICHSTLTNSRTRVWLEAARARQGEEVTGMPSSEYVELSLLEPHKQFQNSVSVFQKRKSGFVEYSEPIFSEYA